MEYNCGELYRIIANVHKLNYSVVKWTVESIICHHQYGENQVICQAVNDFILTQ